MREFGVHIPVLESCLVRTAFFANGGGHVDNISDNYPGRNITGTDEGVWRRVRLVPFDVVIPAAARDEELGDRLALDADAILAWLVNGYFSWRHNGLDEPAAVTSATKAY
jgi:hypothetical protein